MLVTIRRTESDLVTSVVWLMLVPFCQREPQRNQVAIVIWQMLVCDVEKTKPNYVTIVFSLMLVACDHKENHIKLRTPCHLAVSGRL